MANKSILAAFERMWQHTVAAIDSANTFIVTFTQNVVDGPLTVDKTFAEVTAAIKSGHYVYGKLIMEDFNSTHNFFIRLDSYSDYSIIFRSEADGFWSDDKPFSNGYFYEITSDDTVNYAYATSYYLPRVTADDNGKVLTVDGNGAWTATEVPNATNVSVANLDGAITVTATYDNGSESVSVIALDENDYPVSVTTNGVVCNVSWEGFSV